MALQDQRVLVVGGTSGIGLATAHAAHALGAQVLVSGRDPDRLRMAVDRLGGGIHGLAVDAADRAQVTGLFEQIGQIDHLVLALSGGSGGGPIASLELNDLRAGFEGKFWPQLTTLQVALPHIRPSGSVTFITAGSAGAPYPGAAGLAAINGALEAMIPALAGELRPTRINAVSPGVIDTPWWHSLPEPDRQALFARYSDASLVGRIGAPEEVAELIVAVIANTFITGTVMTIDGGLRFSAAA